MQIDERNLRLLLLGLPALASADAYPMKGLPRSWRTSTLALTLSEVPGGNYARVARTHLPPVRATAGQAWGGASRDFAG